MADTLAAAPPPSQGPTPTQEPAPWIHITVMGATAGMTVAAFTFSAFTAASSVAATGAGYTLDLLSSAAVAGTRAVWGDASAFSVRIIANSLSRTSEHSVRQGGLVTAGVVSAAAGAVTALTVTAGTRLIEYSIEYGGKISKEMAVQFSDAYLKFKARHTRFSEHGDTGALLDEDWVVIGKHLREYTLEELEEETARKARRRERHSMRSSAMTENSVIHTLEEHPDMKASAMQDSEMSVGREDAGADFEPTSQADNAADAADTVNEGGQEPAADLRVRFDLNN